jgi:hypothetical protein
VEPKKPVVLNPVERAHAMRLYKIAGSSYSATNADVAQCDEPMDCKLFRS